MKQAIIIIIILAVAIFAYFGFVKDTPLQQALLTSTNSGEEVSLAGQKITNQLRRIEQLNLSTSIFNDPYFRILKDLSTPIPPQDRGRPDPFEQIDPSTLQEIEEDELNAIETVEILNQDPEQETETDENNLNEEITNNNQQDDENEENIEEF